MSASDKKLFNLLLLPAELILSVCDWILLPDIFCVSLCNKRLYSLLLRQKQRATLTSKEKLSFLRRYEHDHPEYFACEICDILHQHDGSESLGLARKSDQITCSLPCAQQWTNRDNVMEDHIWNLIVQPFSFLDLKLAMKRFRCGKEYGISLDSLSYKQVDFDAHKTLFLFSRDAEICTKLPSLYVRRQNIIVVAPANFQSSFVPRGRLIPCFGADLYQMVAGIFTKGQNPTGLAFPYTCDICNTDIEIEFRYFSRSTNKITIIITRWANLGPGLTPEDKLWEAHLKATGGRKRNHACLFDREFLGHGGRPPLKRDKIVQVQRAAFESMTRLLYEDLKLINLSYLRDEDYKHSMEYSMAYIENGITQWSIPFKESKHWVVRSWHLYSRRRSYYSTTRITRESMFADEISPIKRVTTHAGRELLFDLIFIPVKLIDRPEIVWPLPQPAYDNGL